MTNRVVPPGAPAPALENGVYVFRSGDLELAVSPAIGGRVTRFSWRGENILTGPEVVAGGEGSLPNMYGSTFWTSPQGDWGWPPETAIDSEPYRASVQGGALTLQSGAGAVTGYAVQKRFWADPGRAAMTLEYTLENRSAVRAAAPWEISRVPKEGIVFFPASAPPLEQSTLPVRREDGVSWVDIARAPSADSKLFQNGEEGWLAYCYRDLVFIKSFEDIASADQATGEAEIEVFVSGSMSYVELEQQGRYSMAPVGSRTPWSVTWLLERKPPEIAAAVGNAELVAWVRELLASRLGQGSSSG